MAEYQISDKYTFNNSTISRLKKIIIKYRIFTVQFGIYSKATIFFFFLYSSKPFVLLGRDGLV